jgi:hypothetical protein
MQRGDLHAVWPRRPRRSGKAICASRACWSLRASIACRASRASGTRRALRTHITLGPLGTRRASGTRRTGSARWANGTRQALRAYGTLGPLRTRRTGETSGPLGTCRASGASRSWRAWRPRGASGRFGEQGHAEVVVALLDFYETRIRIPSGVRYVNLHGVGADAQIDMHRRGLPHIDTVNGHEGA